MIASLEKAIMIATGFKTGKAKRTAAPNFSLRREARNSCKCY
jgi:hypothetical protein